MGLREQKKQRIRAAIIENSIALFHERGFELTRVRDIAGPLELSDATFFNYFATKDAVLTEWVRGLVDDAFASAEATRSRQSVRVRAAGRAAARSLAERIAGDAEFLAEVWHRVRQSAGHASPRATALVADAQARGELRADLPAQRLADLLVAGLLVAVGGWLAEPEAGTLGARLQAVTDLVLDGSRKRNERVRPPAKPASPASARGVGASAS